MKFSPIHFKSNLKFRKRPIPWKLCIAIGAPILLAALIAVIIISRGEPGTPAAPTDINDPALSTPPGTIGTLPPFTLGPLQTSAVSNGSSDVSSDDPGTSESTPPVTEPPLYSAPPLKLAQTETISGEESDNGKVVLRYQIRYPVFEAANGSGASPDKLNAGLAEIASEYEKYALEELLVYAKQARAAGDTSLPYRLSIDCSVSVCSVNAISVVFTKTEHTGESHDAISQRTYNFSPSSNSAFTLSGIFSVGSSTYQQRIYDAIFAEIQKNTGKYYADYQNLVKFFDLSARWYFSEKGLTIYFNPFEIASYSAGIVQFTLPYSEWSDLLKINPLYMG